ncbi:MAG: hypothetical protein H0X62_13900 [Bacteroidetes bacterium]|nr:hypothetical protein [Bacteroidota bacterium]
MRIVVLGASGQIGCLVVKQLEKDFPDSQIIACSRAGEGNSFKFAPLKDNWELLGKVDVLINCIGIIKEEKNLSFQKAHQGITAKILEQMQSIGNPRLIQISVLGAVGNSPSKFMSTKGKADEHLLQNKNTLVIRPSIVCTPNTMMVRKIKTLFRMSRYLGTYLPIPLHFLNTKIQPVLGAELAEIISRTCVQKIDGIVNVTGPEIINLKELLCLLPKKIRFIPLLKKVSDLLIKPITTFFPSLLNQEQYKLLSKENVADNALCEQILGRKMGSTLGFWKRELNSKP